MGNFIVRYASRVVIYDRKPVIRLAIDPKLKSMPKNGDAVNN